MDVVFVWTCLIVILVVVMIGFTARYVLREKRFDRNKMGSNSKNLNTNTGHRSRKANDSIALTADQLTSLGHEIRTPLTGIIGFTSVLADEALPEQLEFVKLIDRNSQRLLDTLTSWFDLALIDLGRFPSPRDMVDVVEVVRAGQQMPAVGTGERNTAIQSYT